MFGLGSVTSKSARRMAYSLLVVPLVAITVAEGPFGWLSSCLACYLLTSNKDVLKQ